MRINRKSVLLLPLLAMLGCMSPQVDISRNKISEIVVLDADFKVVRVVNDFDKL